MYLLGGAVKHNKYEPIKVDHYGDDWIIFPIDGYGTQDQIRSFLRTQKPDMLWFMTDPRFYEWLWAMDNEVRTHIPMIYYHVWDNHPAPVYNKGYYDSNDLIASISKVTHQIVSEVTSDVKNIYLPHAVDSQFLNQLNRKKYKKLKKSMV